jgi:hypothetical protein
MEQGNDPSPDIGRGRNCSTRRRRVMTTGTPSGCAAYRTSRRGESPGGLGRAEYGLAGPAAGSTLGRRRPSRNASAVRPPSAGLMIAGSARTTQLALTGFEQRGNTAEHVVRRDSNGVSRARRSESGSRTSTTSQPATQFDATDDSHGDQAGSHARPSPVAVTVSLGERVLAGRARRRAEGSRVIAPRSGQLVEIAPRVIVGVCSRQHVGHASWMRYEPLRRTVTKSLAFSVRRCCRLPHGSRRPARVRNGRRPSSQVAGSGEKVRVGEIEDAARGVSADLLRTPWATPGENDVHRPARPRGRGLEAAVRVRPARRRKPPRTLPRQHDRRIPSLSDGAWTNLGLPRQSAVQVKPPSSVPGAISL